MTWNVAAQSIWYAIWQHSKWANSRHWVTVTGSYLALLQCPVFAEAAQQLCAACGGRRQSTKPQWQSKCRYAGASAPPSNDKSTQLYWPMLYKSLPPSDMPSTMHQSLQCTKPITGSIIWGGLNSEFTHGSLRIKVDFAKKNSESSVTRLSRPSSKRTLPPPHPSA